MPHLSIYLANRKQVLSALRHLLKLFVLTSCVHLPSVAQTVSVDTSANSSAGKIVTNSLVHTRTMSNSSITPFDLGGVVVVGQNSPRFQNFIEDTVSAEVAPSVRGVLPYSFTIQNNSSHSIVGFVLSWLLTDSSGQTFTHQSVFFDSLKLESVIGVGNSRLVTPVPFLTEELSNAKPLSDALLGDISNLVSEFQEQASVEISLDAVLFSDGSSIGPDPDGTISTLRRMIQAEFDLYNQLSKNQFSADVISTTKIIAQKNGAQSVVDFTSYDYYQSDAAQELVRVLQAQGVDGLRKFINNNLKNKPYSKFISK